MSETPGNGQTFRIERDTVSRILALLQRQEEIAIDLGNEEVLGPDELRSLLRRVHQRHQAFGVFSRIPFGTGATGKALDPSSGISSTGAVLLAFHAGGRIDLDTLSRALGIDPAETGSALFKARMSVTAPEESACDHMQEAIGRYDDPALQAETLIALVNHSRACDVCSAALKNSRALDERLRETVRTSPAIVPADDNHRASLNRNPMLLLVGILAVVIIAIVTLLVVGYGAARESGAAPLLEGSAIEQEHPGWLLVSTESEIIALDLASGSRRNVMSHPAHDWWNSIIVSPDGDLVVRWEEYSRVEERVGSLRVFDLQGERQFIQRWFGLRTRNFAGWLDNQTVIFTERGPSRRQGPDTETEPGDETSVVAADLTTGEEWVLVQEPMDRVMPSPDGQYLAIIRPARYPWPGKTVDILERTPDRDTELVASITDRHLSWTGRIVWSAESDRIYLSGIPDTEMPDSLPAYGDSAPGTFDFTQMALLSLHVDGSIKEFDPPTEDDPYLIVPQVSSHDDQQLMALINQSGNRDDEWFPALLDLDSGDITIAEEPVAGSRWWNSEALWSPEQDAFLTQKLVDGLLEPSSDHESPVGLQIGQFDAPSADASLLSLQDATSISTRPEQGVALLRWIPDETARQLDLAPELPPRPGSSSILPQSTTDQTIGEETSLDSSKRHLILAQDDEQYRLMHLGAWSGVLTGETELRDLSWLPRESIVIGATVPDDTSTGSRLRFVATDLTSPLHDLEIDPAGIGSSPAPHYRTPVYSPDGNTLAFLTIDEGSDTLTLWQQPTAKQAVPIDTWDWPAERSVEPSLSLTWVDSTTLLLPMPANWENGYPRSVDLVRFDLSNPEDPVSAHLRSFRARGSDRGIDIPEILLAPDEAHLAIRARYLTSSNPENATDAILISPTSDLQMALEVARSSRGDGMLWLDDGEWLVAGLDDRIMLLDRLGQQTQEIDSGPAAFPVLTETGELWYQDRSDDGQIMRVPFALETTR